VHRCRSSAAIVSFIILLPATAAAQYVHATWRLLPTGGVPFNRVDITYGLTQRIEELGAPYAQTWQLDIRAEDDPASEPLVQVRGLTSRDPLADMNEPVVYYRYQIRIPSTGEAYDYRDIHTKRALLPGWSDFERLFIPRPARATQREKGIPHTCELLGHVLTLREVDTRPDWDEWKDLKVLSLDRELLIGSSRTVRDQEGHRLPMEPERQDYHYIQWTREDYKTMIDAGMNIFSVVPGLEEYVRSQPVFYRGGAAGLNYPADLYRSNFFGPVMYLDEPACIMVNNKTVNTTLKYFTDAAALLTKRVRRGVMEKTYDLEAGLRERGIPLGDMRLAQPDFVSWETRYETAYYHFAGGVHGFVHEGRYQLDEFKEFARASTGLDRVYSPDEMFRYYFAVMRGAARRFGGDWGTSIYGQADPRLSPTAIRLAYDMGARYVWYWTSDHDHHMPWPEQLELTRTLKRHAAEHPRPSIRGEPPVRDKLILIPYGYFLVLESPTQRRNCWDLWWVREMDAEGRNESSQRYRRLMQNAFREINKALDAGEDFDITVDDGSPADGYRKVVRVSHD
jgi:hypothetical protein